LNTVVVLAMHGAPPSDFPRAEAAEFFSLHSRLNHATGPDKEEMERRYTELEARMRAWPRTAQNDPYYAAAQALAAELGPAADATIEVGFNEFCNPTLDEALDSAMTSNPDRVVVVTPMMTRGGGHSEVDIPQAVNRAKERHPGAPIVFAWPFAVPSIAQFLASQIKKF
jgi:sirohydrochlorin cobaltochelatase